MIALVWMEILYHFGCKILLTPAKREGGKNIITAINREYNYILA